MMMPKIDGEDQAEQDRQHNQLIQNQLRRSVRNLQPMNGSRFTIKGESGQAQPQHTQRTQHPKQGDHMPAASSENREGLSQSAHTVKQAAQLLNRNRSMDGSSRIHLK